LGESEVRSSEAIAASLGKSILRSGSTPLIKLWQGLPEECVSLLEQFMKVAKEDAQKKSSKARFS
jgi:hypothetical protein